MQKHSVKISDHTTSISLEQEFWSELKRISKEKNLTISELVTQIDNERENPNLSSAIRIYILNEIKNSPKKKAL